MSTKSTPIKTTCPYCGVGCGVLASTKADGTVSIVGDGDHPANYGKLCSKGSALGETMALDDRLLQPLVDGVETDWDPALDLVAQRFSETIAEHGPDSVAFYVSGQLLTEDYYVTNKLMKGFIGSANIDTNSRLCMSSSVAGHKRAFGTDTVPGCYEDVELADVIVLVGSNLAWCHPVLYQRLVVAKKKRGTKVVVIDPRRTATCDIADLHLSIAPGADVALFNGLLMHLNSCGQRDDTYVNAHTTGCESALQTAGSNSLDNVADITELPRQDIEDFYTLFANNQRVVSIYSQGVNQSTNGTDKVNAIINCHLLTGRIGKPGMGPFSVTGQPNAMGGREVGGLSNQLASHMELSNARHRDLLQTFWKSPAMAEKPGPMAVDLFREVRDGRIKALWIMATNPVVSLPEADSVREAIANCPFVVVSDVVRHTDTTAVGDVLLPAAAWGEKDGTVTNSERCISRQRPFLDMPEAAKPDWWIICEVAKRMGFTLEFDYSGPAAIFDEYTRSTALENDGARDLDLGGLSGLDDSTYNALAPTIWPVPASQPVSQPQSKTTRFFANGNFYTPDRKARLVATPYRPARTQVSQRWPLVLNTGRIRDQWHTMTRTAKAPRLMGHIGEPFIEVHADDAARFNLSAASLGEISSEHGTYVARVVVTDRQRAGSVFAPMHWTYQYSAHARVDVVVSGDTDPISGQPESKYTPVTLKSWPARWFGFALLRSRPETTAAEYWALAAAESGWRLELAGLSEPDDWSDYARRLMAQNLPEDDLVAYHDQTTHQHRFAAFDGDQLVGALFIAPQPVAVSRSWAAGLLTTRFETPAQKLSVLAARPGVDQPDPGAIVCSCFSVGVNQITSAIASGHGSTVDDIGKHLGAGTNCGSCRAEIGSLIDEGRIAEAS